MNTSRNLCALVLLPMLLINLSCSDDTQECQINNSGMIIIENTRPKGTLQVFINRTGTIAINGPGDLNIKPGEKASIQQSAGQHNLKARLSITSCDGGRCHTSTSGLPEKNVNLSSCDDFNLVY